jgi:hypothetical protein
MKKAAGKDRRKAAMRQEEAARHREANVTGQVGRRTTETTKMMSMTKLQLWTGVL